MESGDDFAHDFSNLINVNVAEHDGGNIDEL
jgi:hypothetical protein